MSGRPFGAEVGLCYDTSDGDLEVGHFLRTGTGRSYVVTAARQAGTPRPPHRVRWRLRAVVVRPEEVPNDAVVWPVGWYSRRRSTVRP